MNTRSYHRNSVMAFPKTTQYGCSIERPAKRYSKVNVALWLGLLVVLLAIAFQGAPT